MTTSRQDVATLGSGWNKVLWNHALAMQALDELPIANRNSWKLLGAIHGFRRQVASQSDGPHGGGELSYTIDITDLAQRLTNAGDFDLNHLRVTLVPGEQISADNPVTVERISVLKRSGVVS